MLRINKHWTLNSASSEKHSKIFDMANSVVNTGLNKWELQIHYNVAAKQIRGLPGLWVPSAGLDLLSTIFI